MIISASRRTDIPAFFTKWFIDRVRAGFCEVANPYRADQISRVSLLPEDVDVIVFITRNAAPILPYLSELDALGLRYYFHYTLTGYPRELEARTPSVDDALGTLRRLAEHVGSERIIWRYDPIVFTEITPPAYHAEQFARLADVMHGLTRQVKISIMDDYRWVTARMNRLAKAGINRLDISPDSPEFATLMQALVRTAGEYALEIVSCAEPFNLQQFGIAAGKCVDDGYIRRVFGIDVTHRKDPSQRKPCGCVVSKDIGVYNTCRHGCIYCYATRSSSSGSGTVPDNSSSFRGTILGAPADK